MKNFTQLLVITTLLLFPALSTFAGDGYLTSVSVSPYVKTNTGYTIKCNLKNASGSNITQFKIGWTLDNGSINWGQTVNISSGGLPTGGYYMPHTHNTPLNVSSQGAHVLKIWVQAVGETNYANDTVTVNFKAIDNYASKVTLFEVYTATWCQHCPPANTVAQDMASSPEVAVAKFHNSDSYSFTAGENYMEDYYPSGIFTPGGVLDMGEFGGYEINSGHNTWGSQVSGKSGSISPVAITLSMNVNSSTKVLTADIDVNFKYAEAGDYYINAYILESGISGPQTNAPAGYIHNNLVRHMLGGATGTGGIIPSSPAANTDYSHSYNYTIPSGWDIDKLTVIAVVFKKESNTTWAANAAKAGYITSVEEPTKVDNSINIYPNPFNDFFTVELPQSADKVAVEIYSIDGQMVYAKEYGNTSNYSLLNIDMSGMGLSPGFYTLRLQADNYTYAKRLVKF